MKTTYRLTTALALSACALTVQAQQPTSGSGASPMSLPPAIIGGNPPPPNQAQPPAPGPSMQVAMRLAHAAVAACRGYHVGVTVLNAAGYPKLVYIPDGSHGFHAFMSFRKASTALAFRMPSGRIGAATKANPALAAAYRAHADDFITFAGGLPLMRGHELIGALGVSGADPSAKDEACAAAAIKSVSLTY
ncbi:MAG: GlcG/HbpS family heme-binding protein [Gemmataceae bacterium]